MSRIDVSGLCVSLGGRELYRDFSLCFEECATTVVLGGSGAGKTTLLDCVAGLRAPHSGMIEGRRANPSYLFQEPRLLPWCTLLKNVSLPLENVMDSRSANERALSFLERTGLSGRANDYPNHLSGGERQRTAIARAFAYPSDLLLMDEAFQSQDIVLKIQLMDLFLSLLDTGKRTVISVTHDIREALFLGTRIVVIGAFPVQVLLDIVPKRQGRYTDTLNSEAENEILRALSATPSAS